MPTSNTTHGEVKIRLAETNEERERIYAFRYQIYVEELHKNQLSSANHSTKQIHDTLDETGLLFYAAIDDEIIATLRGNLGNATPILDRLKENYDLEPFLEEFGPSNLSFTSRLMVARHKRGSNVLAHLLGYSYQYGLQHGVRLDFCHCQPSLIRVYQHLGYRRYKHNFVDAETGYRIPLVLVMRDIEHMRNTRSPLLRILRRCNDEPTDKQASAWICDRYPMTSQESTHWLLGEQSYWQYLADKLAPLPHHALRLFAGLSKEQIGKIIKEASLISAKSGDPLIRAGDRGDEMYLLLSGYVDVWDHHNQKLLATFEPGDVFGELAFVAKIVSHLHPIRSANVVAAEDCEVLIITQSVINKLTKTAPEIAVRIAFNLASILGERMLISTVPQQEHNSETGVGPAA